MLDSEFSLQTYIDEITPMVQEISQDRQNTNKFELMIQQLRDEMRRCDDNLTIYLCWQDHIGRQLGRSYSDQELLKLHGYPHGTIYKTGTHHTIVARHEHIIDFHWCKHQYYTPIRTVHTIHQCLKCP